MSWEGLLASIKKKRSFEKTHEKILMKYSISENVCPWDRKAAVPQFSQGLVLGTVVWASAGEETHLALEFSYKSQYKLYNRPMFKTCDIWKWRKQTKINNFCCHFPSLCTIQSLGSFVHTMARGDCTTLSCRAHPWLALYKAMKNRVCDVVLVLVWRWIELDVPPGGVSRDIPSRFPQSLVRGSKILNVESDSKWFNSTCVSP